MGLFSSIGKTLFGSGGGSGAGYTAKALEQGAWEGIGNRAGARQYRDKKGRVQYDFSGTGKQIGMPEATSGYDYSGVDQAKEAYKNPSLFKETYSSYYNPNNYKATQFNFANVPDTIASDEYNLGAKDIRREGAGSLEKLKETVGPRSLGMLAKLSENASRQNKESLAGLRGNLNLQAAKQKVDLTKEQQLAQDAANQRVAEFLASEGYKEYGSKADLEKLKADQAKTLADISLQDIESRKGITKDERDYQDRALEYLMQQYAAASGRGVQNAELGQKNRGMVGKAVGGIGKIATKFI